MYGPVGVGCARGYDVDALQVAGENRRLSTTGSMATE